MTTLKYGLNLQKKPQKPGQKPAAPKKKAIFGDDDSDDDDGPAKASNEEEIGVFDLDAPAPASKSTASKAPEPATKTKPKPKPQISQYGDLSSMKSSKKHMDEATALDPSIYDYDAAYDALHAKSEAKKAADRADAQERKPKYMENLLAAAEVRKRDQLKAKDAMLQREREEEGDEFADKETFVTGAYKQQQEEVQRLAEEEEKRREAEEAKRRTGQGLQSFRRNMLNLEDRRHQESIEAIDEAAKKGGVSQSDAPKEKTDLELAQELRAQGTNVITNDEGQVVDKRQLLVGGLNIQAKPKAEPSTAPVARPSGPQQSYQGRSSGQKAMRERQTRMMEAQLEQAAKRAADDEAEEQRKLEHAAKSRKTVTDISSAKERYLQRKREAAAAKAKGE